MSVSRTWLRPGLSGTSLPPPPEAEAILYSGSQGTGLGSASGKSATAALVTVFGHPMVSVGEREIRLSPQQLSLLLLIFAHPAGAVTRSQAAWLIWERDPDPVVRQRLRQLISGMVRKVGSRIILAQGDLLLPDLTLADSDWYRFGRLTAHRQYSAAAKLLNSGFAVGMAPFISRALEDWVQARARRLEVDLVREASAAWDLGRTREDWSAALDAAEALQALRPDDGRMLARLMEAQVRTGQPAAAETAYSLFVDSLPAGTLPDASLRELAVRVSGVAAFRPVQTETHGADASSAGTPGPLLGRRREMREVLAVLDSIAAGGSESVLVRGTRGIGKSRLLEEMRRVAVLRGFRWITVRGVVGSHDPPFAAVVDALGTLGVEMRLEEVGHELRSYFAPWLPPRLLADVASTRCSGCIRCNPESGDPLPVALRFLRDILRQLVAGNPTVLCVDNLQWVDVETVTLLQMLEARWRIPSLGIVGAVIDGGDPPSRELSTYLRRGSARHSIELSSLPTEASLALAAAYGGAEMGPATARLISELAANHPRYVVELAQAHVEGKLALPNHPLDPLVIPPSLLTHFESVLVQLTPSALRVAAIMAIMASPSPLLELASLTGMSPEGLTEALTELRNRAIVVVEDGLVRLPHAVMGAAVTSAIGPARRALLHRQVADMLAKPNSRARAGTLAAHYARAGDHRKAVLFAKQAVDEAKRLGDNRGTVANLELVVRHCSNEDERVRSAADLAEALCLDRRLGRALPVLDLAITGLCRAGDHRKVIALELFRIEALAEAGRSTISEIHRLLDNIRTEASALGDEEGEAAALVAGVRFAARTGVCVGAYTVSRLKRMAREARGRARLHALWGLSSLAYDGSPTARLRSGLRALRLTRAGRDHDRLLSLNALLPPITLLGMMSLPSARRLAAEAQMLARGSPDVGTRCSVMVELGIAALGAGDHEAAEAHLRQALQGYEHAELSDTRFRRELALGDLYLERNSVPEARKAFQRAARAVGGLSTPNAGTAIQAGLMLCDLAIGSLRNAVRHEVMPAVDPGSPNLHAFLTISAGSHMLAAAQRPHDAVAHAAAHCDALEGQCVPCWVRLRALEASLALRHRVPVNLARLSEALQVVRRLRLSCRVAELEALLNRARARG